MAKKPKEIKTNVNIHYLMPICPLSDPYKTDIREVKVIGVSGNMIRCQDIDNPELYEIHSFYDEYFQWLIHTGHILPLEDTK